MNESRLSVINEQICPRVGGRLSKSDVRKRTRCVLCVRRIRQSVLLSDTNPFHFIVTRMAAYNLWIRAFH
jgi:hypothetical protein